MSSANASSMGTSDLGVRLTHNKQLERTVLPYRQRAAGAPLHYAPAARWTRGHAAAQLQRYASLLTAVAVMLTAHPAIGQLLLLGPACETFVPSEVELDAVREATSILPKNASLARACIERTFTQVRPGVMHERNATRYLFRWTTGAKFGELEHWESARCERDTGGQVACSLDAKGVRKPAGSWISVGAEVSDNELAEVLEFARQYLGEDDVEGIWKYQPEGRIDWSTQTREYGLRVRKEDISGFSYRLTRTCTFAVPCSWKAEGPSGPALP